MKQYGFYSYIKPNTNIKTRYIIEFTRDKKVIDIMGTSKFTWDMLEKRELDYLQDAINLYNVLYYDESVLHVLMHEQIIYNDDVILEQFKDQVSFNILPQKIQQEISKVEEHNKLLQEENNIYKEFCNKCNLSISDIKKQLETA